MTELVRARGGRIAIAVKDVEHRGQNAANGSFVNGKDLRTGELPSFGEITCHVDFSTKDHGLDRDQRFVRQSPLNWAGGAKGGVSALNLRDCRCKHPIKLHGR